MNNLQQLQQIFQNNLGNRLTVELCNGMLQEIAKLMPTIQEVTELPKGG